MKLFTWKHNFSFKKKRSIVEFLLKLFSLVLLQSKYLKDGRVRNVQNVLEVVVEQDSMIDCKDKGEGGKGLRREAVQQGMLPSGSIQERV